MPQMYVKVVEDDTIEDDTTSEEEDTVSITELYVPVLKMMYTKLKDTTVEVGGDQPARITFVTRTGSTNEGWSSGDHLAHNDTTFLKQKYYHFGISELKKCSPMDYELDEEGNKFAFHTEGYVTKNGTQIANFKDLMLSYVTGRMYDTDEESFYDESVLEELPFARGIAYNSAFVDDKGNWYVIFTAGTSNFTNENWDYGYGDENDYIPEVVDRNMVVIYNGTPTMIWSRAGGNVNMFVSSYEPVILPCKNGFFFEFTDAYTSGSADKQTTDNYYQYVSFYDADKNPLFSISHDDLINAMWWCSERRTLYAYWKPYRYEFYEEIYSVLFNTAEACPMDWQSTFSLLKINETAYLILINQNVNGNRDILSTHSVYAVEHAGDYNILLLWDKGKLTCLGLNLAQDNIKFISDPQAFQNATLETF